MAEIIYPYYSKIPKVIVITSIFLVLSIVHVKCSDEPQSELKLDQNCGKLDLVPTDIRSFAPWTVAIFRRAGGPNSRWKFHTSGTIATPRHVGSIHVGPPGRFPSDKDPRNFLIVAGVNTTDFSKHDEFAQYSRVTLILSHKAFFESQGHNVHYYLETPLDFSTPFVKPLCLSNFLADRKNQFLGSLQLASQGSVNLVFPVSGFARQRSNDGNDPNSGVKSGPREWTLKVWKFVYLPENICASIFRFHYGLSSSPFCFRRTMDNASSFLSGDEILQQIQVPSEYSQHDDDLCLSHGSRASWIIGGKWFVGSMVGFLPGGRCSSKTVYGALNKGSDPAQLYAIFQWVGKIIKCGDDNFPCASFNSSRCIPLNKACDNIWDCEDESDEHPDICAWKTDLTVRKEIKSAMEKVNPDLQLDARDLTQRCPDFEFVLEGVRCIDPETLEKVNCTSPFYYGRRIRVECDRFYTAAKYTFDHMDLFCNFDGQWMGYRPIYCQKECGIFDEKDNKTKNFPWEISIFANGVETCGGTLIYPTFVLTDGRCVKNWIESPESRSTIQVSLTHNALKHQIKNSWVSSNFGDSADQYENGVGLIQLLDPVDIQIMQNLSTSMAACFFVRPLIKTQLIQTARVGSEKVAVVSSKNCSGAVKQEGFCTTSPLSSYDINADGPGSLKIGAGLVFSPGEKSPGKSKYVLQGILSGTTEDGRGIFKNLDSHADWILNILEASS